MVANWLEEVGHGSQLVRASRSWLLDTGCHAPWFLEDVS